MPSASKPRSSTAGSTENPALSSDVLIATFHRLARLKINEESRDASNAAVLADKRVGSKAAHSSSWVSSRNIERSDYLPLSNIASMSCAKAAFRSSSIVPRPAKKPSSRVAGNTLIGTTRTISLPALAMTNSWPLEACSTKRERWDLALWRLTVMFIGARAGWVDSRVRKHSVNPLDPSR